MKEETELDALARMVANGFSSMEKYMDERFGAVDARFDLLESKVDATNARIDTIVMPTIEDHSRRIKDLEIAAA